MGTTSVIVQSQKLVGWKAIDEAPSANVVIESETSGLQYITYGFRPNFPQMDFLRHRERAL